MKLRQLYEDIMKDVSLILKHHLSEDMLDDIKPDTSRTSSQKALDQALNNDVFIKYPNGNVFETVPSDDPLKNEIIRLYGHKFSYLGYENSSHPLPIDKFLTRPYYQEEEYVMRIWDTTGYPWRDNKHTFASIHPNGGNKTVWFRKTDTGWTVRLHETG